MRKDKKKMVLLATVVLAAVLALLTGCGGDGVGADKSASVSSNYTTSESVYMDAEADNASYKTYNAAVETTSDSSSDNAAVNGETKRINSGSISLETTAFSAAYQSIRSMAEEDGAWLESDNSGTYGYNGSRYANLTIRVPADRFQGLLEAIGGTENTTVVSKNVSAEDVSEEYYDTEGRLDNAKAKLKNLQELSKQAENVQDLIAIEDAISDVQYNIEYLQGQVNRYDSQINYSSIYVTLSEVNVMSGNEEGYGLRLIKSFQSGFYKGVDMAANLVLWLAQNWLVLILVLVILSGVLRLIRFGRRKRKAQKEAGKKQEQAEGKEKTEEEK